MLALFKLLQHQRDRDYADAEALDRHGHPQQAEALRARASDKWAETVRACPKWLDVTAVVEDTGWCRRSLTDLAKAIQRIDLGLDTRVRKAGTGRWQFSLEIALRIPRKGETPLPSPESFRIGQDTEHSAPIRVHA